MAIAKKKKSFNFIAQIRKLRAENATLRAKLEEKEPNWKELNNVSLTLEERKALLGR